MTRCNPFAKSVNPSWMKCLLSRQRRTVSLIPELRCPPFAHFIKEHYWWTTLCCPFRFAHCIFQMEPDYISDSVPCCAAVTPGSAAHLWNLKLNYIIKSKFVQRLQAHLWHTPFKQVPKKSMLLLANSIHSDSLHALNREFKLLPSNRRFRASPF